MAKLSKQARASLPKKDFAVPSKAPGSGSYPVNDAQHCRSAKGFAAMHNASSSVKAAINKKCAAVKKGKGK